jgi:hypothetical protein
MSRFCAMGLSLPPGASPAFTASGEKTFSVISRRRAFKVCRDLRSSAISFATGSAGATAPACSFGSGEAFAGGAVCAFAPTQSSVNTQSAAVRSLARVVIF